MGCNKSKSQHGGSEAHINGEHTNPWEVGQEAHSLYGENSEFNQNGFSNSGFHSVSAIHQLSPDHYQLSGDQFRDNSEQQTGDGYSNVNATRSFGIDAPACNPNSGYNNMQYFSTNEYNVSAYNHSSVNGSSAPTNSMYSNFSQEQFQGTYIQQQYHNQPQCQSGFNQEQICGAFDREPIMGPPSRPISRPAKCNYNMPRLLRPLARRRSFNDDYNRAHQNTYYNTMVRHSSLENIPTGFRIRSSRKNCASDNNLFWNSSVGNEEEYPRWRNSRRRGRQRGLKRNSWDGDSLNSNKTSSENSGPITENVYTPEVGPRVKRRPSDIDDPYTKSADMSNDDRKVEREEINCNNEIKTMHKSVEHLNLYGGTFDILDLLMFPEEWSSCAVGRTGFVDISLTSPEGKSVQKYFSRSSQSKDFKLCITAIARIENPFMHSYYLLKKQEMESRNEHVDELYLYHGTKKEHLSGILEDNLNWRLYSEKHRFGQGVSFSPLATYSSHYSDKTSEKVMLLFKVLASNSIGGSPDMKVPPTIDNVVYDASIKDDTTVIVKYSDNEFYPLYKITYLKIMRN